MNRIERVREYVDAILLDMSDTTERRCGYLHLYEGFRVSLKFYYKFQDLKALFVNVVNSQFVNAKSCLCNQVLL